jgi:peroxiredoxin Q/BCP
MLARRANGPAVIRPQRADQTRLRAAFNKSCANIPERNLFDGFEEHKAHWPGENHQESVMAASKVKSPKSKARTLTTPRNIEKAGKMTKPITAPKQAAFAKGGSESLNLIGKSAPAFALPDQDGNHVSLDSLTARGNVVLYFYPKDMTPGCTTEACSFRDNLGAMRAMGAQVVGVSADSADSHRKFIAKHSLNFPLLSDPQNAITRAYGVYKKKSLYGREFMGIERTTFIIGRDGAVKKVFPKVKVNSHTDEVIAALKDLG